MTVELSKKIKIKGKSVLTILLKVVSQHTHKGDFPNYVRKFPFETGSGASPPTPQEQEQRQL